MYDAFCTDRSGKEGCGSVGAGKKNWKRLFFPIWVGQAFSLFGSSVVDFALIWYLTEQTGSERVLAFSTLLTLVPRMILGPFAGSLIDRLKRRTVMLLADGAIALVTLALLLVFIFFRVPIWLVLVVLLLRSLGAMFHQPALQSSTAILVPEEGLSRVGGLNRVLTGAMSIIAPAAGAALIELFDVSAVLYVDLVTAAIAMGTLFCVRFEKDKPPRTEHPGVIRETLEGLRYVCRTKSLFFVVGTCTLANFFCGPCNAMVSLLVTKVFHGGVSDLSAVSVMSGIGMIAGGILMGAWGGFRRKLITSGLGWGVVGIGAMAIGIVPRDSMWPLMLCYFVIGAANAVGGASLEAFYQSAVPTHLHGRVFSVLATLDNTTVPIGLVAAAILGDKVPIPLWYVLMGVLHFSLCVFWMGSRSLKEAENT